MYRPSRPTPSRPSPAKAPQLSDISVGGDPLALPSPPSSGPRHPVTVADFAGLTRSIAADRDRWAPLVRYDPVTRWYHRLQVGPGYEVWLLSWLPGQGTGAHDHGRSSGVFTVLDGCLTERSAVRGAEVIRRRLTPVAGASPAAIPCRVVAPGCVHEVVNETLDPAVSLHVYFPGLTEMPGHPHLSHLCGTPAEKVL